MKINGDAIYGTAASPFPYEFGWGRMTQKHGKLYLLFTKWPRGHFTLYGLRNKVKKATLLADPKAKIEVCQCSDAVLGHHALELKLPRRKPDKRISVVVLDIAGEADVVETPVQQPDGSIRLPAHMADLHVPKTGRQLRIDRGGITESWHTRSNSVSWDVQVTSPGDFEVVVHTALRGKEWRGGHTVAISVGRQKVVGKIVPHEMIDSPRSKHVPEALTRLGTLTLAKAGTHTLKLKALDIATATGRGLTVSEVKLLPVAE